MAKKVKKQSKPRGNPKLILDADKIELMAASFLPVESIAKIIGCNPDTLYVNYSENLQRGRENRKYGLACAMWHKALEEKDTKMMIWLSKQHLGYRDQLPEEAQKMNFNVYVNEVPR